MTENLPRNAIAYLRICDARGGVRSLEDQERDIRARAAQLGWRVTRVLTEPDTSAWKRRKVEVPGRARPEWRVVRPRFREALDELWAGRADGFLAYDLDRVCRALRDLEDLVDVVTHAPTRPAVESVTGSLRLGSSADIAMARVMVTMAAKSSDDTSRRVAREVRTRAENGRAHGGRRPYGYTSDGMTLVEEEAAEVRAAADMLLRGTSLRAVVRDLNMRGVPTASGRGIWTSQTMRDLLLRPRVAGLSVHHGEVVGRAAWPPLLDEGTWRRVKSLLEDPTRRTAPLGGRVRWLGSGIYRCGACGGPLRVTKSSGAKVPTYRCWHPDPNAPGPHAARRASELDDHVVGALLVRLSDPRLASLRAASRGSVDTARLAAQANTLAERERALKAALADPDEDLADVRAALRTVRERLAEARAELEAATTGHAPDPVADLAAADDVVAAWAALDLDRRRPHPVRARRRHRPPVPPGPPCGLVGRFLL